MKKLLISFFQFLIFTLSAQILFTQTKIISNTKLEKFIEPNLYTEKTIFQNVAKKLLTEDFDAFVYFLTTSYIGYDKMIQNGFVLNAFITNINSKIEEETIKTSDDLIKNIYDYLRNYICDTHFAIANNNSIYNFNSKFYKERTNLSNNFTIIKNANSTYLSLPNTLPDFFSEEMTTKVYFEKLYTELKNIRQKKYIIIDLRNSPGGVTDYPLLLLYSLYKGRDVIVPSEIYDARQLESEIIYKTSESLETPVTESLRYQLAVYTGNAKYEDIFKTSSVMQKNNPRRILKREILNSTQKIHKPAYKGKIIFLTNNKTASAAESLILFCRVLFPRNTKIIGESTMGCLTYIDVFQITMPNNSFAISMAVKSIEESLKQFAFWKGEGVGIEPDIVCSNEDLLQNLIKITKDKRMKL